jgi:3-phenylpropionate/cinnamic acid dioxygenase small subunit
MDTTDNSGLVEALAEERAIHRLMAVYSQLLDDGRFDEWAELFTADAVFSVWGTAYTGRDAIRDGIGGMQPEHPGKHVAFATVVDLDGERARAWTDFVTLADVGPGEWGRSYSVATAARYYDQLVRDGGRWRFARRDIRMAGTPQPDGAIATPPS